MQQKTLFLKEEKGRKIDLDYNNIKLSVIIPVYNTSSFLRKCLESVVSAMNRVEESVEVLIINDGSTDHSSEIIAEYIEKYPQYFKSFDKPNGGLSDVKNYGLERASGEYVIFLDSDDYIEPDMYQDMLSTAKREQADVVVCDIKLVYDDETRNKVWPCAVKTREGNFAQVIDMSMMPASWNKIVKRELYKGLTFPVGKNNEDVAVTPIVLGRAKKISIIDKPYYNYYQRMGSIQNSEFNEKRFVILETAKLCDERVRELSREKQERIKGSVYLHQVLSLLFYPIREEKFARRYELLKKYMQTVNELFPNIWDNFEIKELVTWGNCFVRVYRKISVALLKKNQYLLICVFWSFVNMIHAMYTFIKRK